MNTKTLSNQALSLIDRYIHFRFGSAVTNVPYFNNKTTRSRAAFRVYIGKGSPEDMSYEIQGILVKNRLNADALADESLKKILADNDLGIECSGFAYNILNTESKASGYGELSHRLSFPYCLGMIGKFRCYMRPIENCNVATFAHEKNSVLIKLNEIRPGDMVTMVFDPKATDRDHILVIHEVEYEGGVPLKIHYSHSVAYPEDGLYGTGVRQGTITITDIEKPISEQLWSEEGKEGDRNQLFIRAKKSKTELRRLNWF